MTDLEYRIGGGKIDPQKLTLPPGADPYDSRHKFVVIDRNGGREMYVANRGAHPLVLNAFGLLFSTPISDVKGGGSCYLDGDMNLVLDSASTSMGGPISQEDAERFAPLLVERLKEKGVVEARGWIANPDKPKPSKP